MEILGIDIGSTGCKSTIMSKDGQLLGQAYREYPPLKSRIGSYELDPNIIWNLVQEVMESSIKQSGIKSLSGISISSLGEAAIPIDEEGRVLYNSILYMDPRGGEEINILSKVLGRDYLLSKTGLKPNGHYTLSKLLWLKEYEKKVYANTWRYLTFAGFILYRLGAKPTIDITLATRTLAFDLDASKMDQTICTKADIDPNIFGEVVKVGTVIGHMSEQCKDVFGLEGNVALISGAHDQICNAVGAGIRENMAIEGIGTVDCITPIFKSSELNQSMSEDNFCKVPYIFDGTYGSYAYNLTGGNLNHWYRNQFCYEESQLASKNNQSVYQIMDEGMPQAPTGLLVLPHFCGSGTPYFDEKSKGAVVGLTLETTKAEFYKGLLEGESYEMYFNMTLLAKHGVNIDKIRAVGGGAKSKGWLQIKSDIMGIQIETINVEEAGTVGAIIIAGVATGIYASYEEAMDMLLEVTETFEPNAKNHRIYQEYYLKYEKLYQLLSSL